MSNEKPWILTKTTSVVPEGYIRLGKIIRTARNPRSSLQAEGPVEGWEDFVHKNKEELQQFDMTKNDNITVAFKAWLKAVGIPVSGSASAHVDSKHDYDVSITKIEGETMEPNNDYIRKAIKSKDVQERIEASWNPKSPYVYMVTGVRLAHGLKMKKNREEKSAGSEAEAQGDGSSHNVPLQGGASGKVEAGQTTSITFDAASDCVFAYTVIAIKVTANSVVKRKEVKGQVSGIEDGQEQQKPVESSDGQATTDQKPEYELEFSLHRVEAVPEAEKGGEKVVFENGKDWALLEEETEKM